VSADHARLRRDVAVQRRDLWFMAVNALAVWPSSRQSRLARLVKMSKIKPVPREV
jgi:hypothetical protein